MPLGAAAFRGKILRAVTIELPQANLETYSPSHAADTLVAMHANLAVVFALGYMEGEAYYPSAFAGHHASLGDRDPFGETVAACRERGLPAVAYVNTLWAGPRVFEQHPDWMQRRLSGEPTRQGNAVTICPSSPYVEHLERVVAEIAEGYEVDGFFFDEPSIQSWCRCENCGSQFTRATGQPLPLKANWRSHAWRAFIEWRFETVGRFIRRLHDAAKRANPDYAVFSQYHFPMATPALDHRRRRWGGAGRIPPEMDDWYRPTYYGERLGEYLPEDIVGTEVYWHSVDKPIWWGGAGTNLCRSASDGRPVLVLTEYPQFPWALTSLPAVDLKVTISDIVAAGGSPWFAWYGPGVGDERGLAAIGEMFGQLARAGTALDGLEPAAEVAVLHSRRTMDFYGRGQVRERALDEILGVYQALLEHQIPVSVISDEDLTATSLARFKVLVLPNAAAMSEAAREAVAKFVGSGGGLVATFESGLYDEWGRPARAGTLDRALGVRRSRRAVDIGIGYMAITHTQEIAPEVRDETLVPCRERQVTLVPGQRATVIARAVTSVNTFGPPPAGEDRPPAMVIATHRRGRSYTFAGNVGKQYYRYHSPEIGAFIAGAVRWAAPYPLTLRLPGAPSIVGAGLFRREDGARVVFLVNYNTTTSTSAPATLPVNDLDVVFRWGKGADQVKAMSALTGEPYETEVRGSEITLRVPRLEFLEAILFSAND